MELFAISERSFFYFDPFEMISALLSTYFMHEINNCFGDLNLTHFTKALAPSRWSVKMTAWWQKVAMQLLLPFWRKTAPIYLCCRAGVRKILFFTAKLGAEECKGYPCESPSFSVEMFSFVPLLLSYSDCCLFLCVRIIFRVSWEQCLLF